MQGERDNASNTVHAGEENHARPGWMDIIKTWTGLPVEESARMTEINGESMSMVRPTLGSRTAKEQFTQTHRPYDVAIGRIYACIVSYHVHVRLLPGRAQEVWSRY